MNAITEQLPVASPVEVEVREILKYLPVYKEDHVTIERCTFDGTTIDAAMRRYTPESYVQPLKHLSRVEAVYHLGQIAYVFGGLLCEAGTVPVSTDEYIEMVREERATFHELHLKFREFLPNRESNHFRMSVKRNDVGAVVIKETREFITMPFEFEIGDGTCFGSSRAVLLKR